MMEHRYAYTGCLIGMDDCIHFDRFFFREEVFFFIGAKIIIEVNYYIVIFLCLKSFNSKIKYK